MNVGIGLVAVAAIAASAQIALQNPSSPETSTSTTVFSTQVKTSDAGVIERQASLNVSMASSRGLEPSPTKSDAVVPIDWNALPSGMPNSADSDRVKGILNNTNKYALTTWWNTAKDFDSQTAAYLDFGGIDEANIRPAASEAFALAVSIKLGAYDPASTGVSLASARAITLKLIRSVAYRHRVNTSAGWGNAWQSGLWASLAGTAGWLMWDELSVGDQELVRKMVEYESTRFVGYKVPYYRLPDGSIVTAGDTKAEENSWNATILQLATAMMPGHRFHRAWMFKDIELMMSAYARPADLANSTVINGMPVSDWIRGSNANDDYTAINHDRIHPDYMITVHQNISASLIFPLAGIQAPKSAFFNAAGIFNALVDENFTSRDSYPGTNIKIYAPGGTIFLPGSGDLYYPQGNDWGTHRRMNAILIDGLADAFSFDLGASIKGSVWEPLHGEKQVSYQARFTDGRTFGASSEDIYPGREEAVAMLAAKAWWTKWIKAKNLVGTTNQSVAIVVDNKDAGFSVVSGTWATATLPDQLGLDHRSISPGTGVNRVRFVPRVPTYGPYEVYAWWPVGSANASNARYSISHTGGISTVVRDQRTGGGKWVSLGNFTFSSGTGNYIELDDKADGRVKADAVLIKPVGTP